MYICEICGNVFDEPVVRSWLNYHGEGMYEPYGEELCPDCGSDKIDKAYQCEECGEYVSIFELYGGLCESCVKDALDADSFFRWALEGTRETEFTCFEDFVFTEIFRIGRGDLPKASSFEMREYLTDIYRTMSDDRFSDRAWNYLKRTANIEEFVDWYIEQRREVS